MTKPCIETKQDLLEAAAQEGESLSEFQLAEWRRRGLIPRPRPGPGRGRGLGRVNCYPGGSALLVREIIRWSRWDRRLDVVVWSIWTDPAANPRAFSLPNDLVANSLDAIIARVVDREEWKREGCPDGYATSTNLFKGLCRAVAKYLNKPPNNEEVMGAAFFLSTMARAEEIPEANQGWPEDQKSLSRHANREGDLTVAAGYIRSILDPMIPGWQHFGVSTLDISPKGRQLMKDSLRELQGFNRFLLEQREIFQPDFLGSWIRSGSLEVENVYRDLILMSGALFPNRVGREPPSPVLLLILLLVRRTRATFEGAQDRYGRTALSRDRPEALPELDPLRGLLDAFPVKKTSVRRRDH